jgi:predicted HAD superfamily Cof-like phosphohydrolase
MSEKFKEAESLNSVALFHETFNHPILKFPNIPSKERCELRVSLIQEELDELICAIKNNDLVEVADALCDLQYVLSGSILEFGMGEKFKDLFDEVQRSNMSKLCSNISEAQETVNHYQKKDGIVHNIIFKGNKFVVYRSSDNKVLKNINYSAADLRKILE